eukprot:466762-Pyramimonas_sp.AAC.1
MGRRTLGLPSVCRDATPLGQLVGLETTREERPLHRISGVNCTRVDVYVASRLGYSQGMRMNRKSSRVSGRSSQSSRGEEIGQHEVPLRQATPVALLFRERAVQGGLYP